MGNHKEDFQKHAWKWDCKKRHRIVNIKGEEWGCPPTVGKDIIKGGWSYTSWNLTATTGGRGGEGDRGVTNVYVTIATNTIQRLFRGRMENKASIYPSIYGCYGKPLFSITPEHASHLSSETFQTPSVSSWGLVRKDEASVCWDAFFFFSITFQQLHKTVSIACHSEKPCQPFLSWSKFNAIVKKMVTTNALELNI